MIFGLSLLELYNNPMLKIEPISIALFGHDPATISTLIPLIKNKNIRIRIFCPLKLKKRFERYLGTITCETYFYSTPTHNDLIDAINEFSPDYIISSGLYHKLSGEIIRCAKEEAFNIHPSLLPSYKGQTPWFWIIKNGEKTSGVSIHKLTDTYDSGDIAYQIEFPINTFETFGSLMFKSSYFTEQAVTQFIPQLMNKDYKLVKQKDADILPKPSVEDKTINWHESAKEIENLVRAGNPIYTITGRIQDQPYSIIECEATTIEKREEPISIINEKLYVSASDYLVEIRIINAKTFGIITGTQFLLLAGLIQK